MNSQKIAVTGGAGFIGTNLLNTLKKRYPEAELISIDIREPAYPVEGVSYISCDVKDSNTLNSALGQTNKIFHLAAIIGTHESLDYPIESFNTNVGGTINVLEYARINDAEVFLAGMPGIWNNPYSISKDAAIRMALSYYETYGVKVTALRWFSVYGPYQYVSRYNKAVPTFINCAVNNQPMPVYGDGQQVSDYIHVDDACNFAIEMVEKGMWGEVIECASGEGISVNNLVDMITKFSNSKSKTLFKPMRAGEPTSAKVVANTDALFRLFPDYKMIDLPSGIKKTIHYYKEHPPVD